MKPIRKWMFGCGLGLCLCCGGPLAWFFVPPDKYPVGANIKDLGLTPGNYGDFIWASSSREPITAFAKKHQVPLAHFTGSIELSRFNDPSDGVQFQFLDGKLANKHGPYHDLPLTEDLVALKNGRLSDMLAKTTNDWRIVNHNNYFIKPDGPFTGTITRSLRGFLPFNHVVILNVKNGVIIRARRSIQVILS